MKYQKLTEEQKQLVEEHYQLTVKLAREYYQSNAGLLIKKKIDEDDILQVASLLLCNFAKKHNKEKSQLSTYLYNFLKLAITREVERYNILKIPNKHDWSREVNKGREEEYRSILYGDIIQLDFESNNEEYSNEPLLNLIPCKNSQVDFDEFLLEEVIDTHINKKDATIIKLNLKGYTNKNISETMGITIDAVKGRLQRTRKTLKGILINSIDKI